MSIADAINNARQKINNAYTLIGLKGGIIPAERNLDNLVAAINGVSSQIFNWNFKGYPNGQLVLDSYEGDWSKEVQVPNVGNYIYLNNATSSPFYSKTALTSVDMSHVPFQGTNVYRSFYGDIGLKQVTNLAISNDTTSVRDLFSGCTSLETVSSSSKATGMGMIDIQVPTSVTDAQGILGGCNSRGIVALKGDSITSVNGALSSWKIPFSIYLDAPNITSAVNFCNNYSVSGAVPTGKAIRVYYRFSNGVNTPTYNTFKSNVTYTGGGTEETGYYNATTGFQMYDLGDSKVNYTLNTTTKEITFTNVNLPGLYPRQVILYPPYPDYKVNSVYTNCFTGSKLVSAVDFVGTPPANLSLMDAFKNCVNLVTVFRMNDSIVDMTNTFYNCQRFEGLQALYPFGIPSSVNFMNNTFYNCVNLMGDIRIYSSNVQEAYNCFRGTTNTKAVYIPYNYTGTDKRTATFNAFVNAGYLYANGTSKNQHGVTMYDLSAQ